AGPVRGRRRRQQRHPKSFVDLRPRADLCDDSYQLSIAHLQADVAHPLACRVSIHRDINLTPARMPALHAEDGAEKSTVAYPSNIFDRLCSMRGIDQNQSALYSYLSPEERVPADHPLRRIREMGDLALGQLSRRLGRLYSRRGRPSVAPEKLIRALLLQVLYSIRSERLLMEQLDYNLLFRWFEIGR